MSTAQIEALHTRLIQAGYTVHRAREANEQSAEGTPAAATAPLDLGVLVNPTSGGGNREQLPAYAGTVSHIRTRPVGKGLAVDLR